MNNDNITTSKQDDYRIIDGKLFVNVNKFSPEQKREIMIQLKHDKNLNENIDKYKWNKLSHQMFIVAAMAFGVKSVTPKQILSVLHDKEPELTREKVGSHL